MSSKRPDLPVSFLLGTNPEIFQIKPRPGGIIDLKKLIIPTRNVISTNQDPIHEPLATSSKIDTLQVQERISKEFLVQTALENLPSDDSFPEPPVPNPLNDSIYMLGISLSTIILMATGAGDIPEEYFIWTKNYLNCIRDEFGNHPPNIQGILNHIAFLKGGGEVPKGYDERRVGKGGEERDSGKREEGKEDGQREEGQEDGQREEGQEDGQREEGREGEERGKEGEGGEEGVEDGEKTVRSVTRVRVNQDE